MFEASRRYTGVESLVLVLLFFLLSLPLCAEDSTHTDCSAAHGKCLVASEASPEASSAAITPVNSARLVPVAFLQGHGTILAHHWIEIQTSDGPVTLGFGSALLPFIDRGQITIEDAQGNVQHEYALHRLPFYLNFGRAIGTGRELSKTLYIPIARADRIVEEQRHRRFIFPYIPFFHDCRTYVCAMQASIKGKSKLPCYFLFKGYW